MNGEMISRSSDATPITRSRNPASRPRSSAAPRVPVEAVVRTIAGTTTGLSTLPRIER